MKKFGFLALLLLPLLVLYGCGSSSSSGSASSGDSATGSMTVSAKFPSGGKQGEVGTALIDSNTQCIAVWVNHAYDSEQVFLTPSAPSNTITDIAVGGVRVEIYTTDGPYVDDAWGGYCSGNELDYLYVAGAIAEGANTLTATLIRGSWTLSSPIALNKTLTSSTEIINGFTINPAAGNYMYGGGGAMGMKAAISETKPASLTEYPLFWKGSGLLSSVTDTTTNAFNECLGGDTYCIGLGGGEWGWEYRKARYYTQFIGPSTSNNAIDDAEIQLEPNTAFTNTIELNDWDYGYGYPSRSNRFAFFFGLPLDFDGSNVDSEYDIGGGPMNMTTPTDTNALPEVNAYATTRATGASTISGNIIEVLEKEWAETAPPVCEVLTDGYWGDPVNQIVTCPPMGGTARVSSASLNKAALKAGSKAMGKAATVGGDGCFTEDLTWSGTDDWTDCYDVWDSGLQTEGQDGYCDQVRVTMSWQGKGKICGHAFTATGVTIPQTELNMIIQ